MKDDPLVEEAREAGQKYIDSFNGDWSAIIEDLRRRAAKEGRTVISFRRSQLKSAKPIKKAG